MSDVNEYDTLVAEVGPVPRPGNEYDGLAGEVGRERGQRLRATVLGAEAADPAATAKAIGLSRKTGLPADMVERNLQRVETDQKLNEYDELLAKAPKLSAWLLADPMNARVAKDDYEQLGLLERGWNEIKRSTYGQRAGVQAMSAAIGARVNLELQQAEEKAARGEYLTPIEKARLAQAGEVRRSSEAIVSEGIRGVQENLAKSSVLPMRPAMKALQASTTWGEAVDAIKQDPLGLIFDLTAQSSPQLAGTLLATLVGGPAAGVATAGLTSFGTEFIGGIVENLQDAGVDVNDDATLRRALADPDVMREAYRQSIIKAAVVATVDATSFGVAGVKLAPRSLASKPVRREAVNLVAQSLVQAGSGAGGEALGSVAAGSEVKPSAVLSEALGELGTAPVELVTMRHAVREARGRARDAASAGSADAAATGLDALIQAAGKTGLAGRSTEKLTEFMQSLADSGEVVYVPAKVVTAYLQSLPPDEAASAAAAFGIADQLAEATAIGGDVVVPLAQYVSRIGQTPAHAAWRDDLRLDPGGMSAREAREFAERYDGLIDRRGEDVSERATEAAAPAQQVYDDVLGQARAAGYTLDAARQYAALFSARYETRAARLGTDAWTEYRRSGVTIEQILPEALQRYTPDELDVMLAELKNSPRRSERKMFGPTLLEFLASKGGLRDVGGDLTAMDADKWHRDKPFRPKLLREDGLGLEDAALAAFESGYFPELVGSVDRPSIDQLLAAVSAELAGRPRRPDSGQNIDADLVDRERALVELDRLLNEAGIDLRTSTVKQAKVALERYHRSVDRGYDQTPVVTVKGDELAPVDADINTLRAAARDFWRANIKDGTVEHPALGTIRFNQQGERKFFSTSANPDKLRLVTALRAIIAGARLVRTTANTSRRPNDNVKAWHWMEADVVIGDRPLSVGFTVFEDHQGNKFYNLNAAPERAKGTQSSDRNDQFNVPPGKAGRDPSYDQNVGTALDSVNLMLLQPDDRGTVRGRIRFEDGRSIVSLFERRDLSTLLHESGHLWLEELAADAKLGGAPQQIRDDLAIVLNWFGVSEAGAITVDHHEQFARAFEAYAMEGKAPSAALGGVFQRFKAWLLSIYRTVAALKTPINDEVRQVFDRLLATDEELAAARDQIGEKRLFASAEQAGMTGAEFEAYTKAVDRSRDRAESDLLKRVMADVRRRREATWKAEEATVREEVTREVDRRADIAALQLLRTGRLPDQGDDVELPRLRLSRAALVQLYDSEAVLGMLPRAVPPLVVEKGGVHPDVVAETVGGFRSGREMVDALMTLEDQQRQLRERGIKRGIRSWLIDDETNRRMVERHGDVLADGSIQEEALAVLHNEDALAVHAVELRALARRAGRREEAAPADLARRWAADTIADRMVRDAVVVGSYQRAERQAAHAVETALLEGDYAEAFRQKEAQLLAAALYAEAKTAAADVESGAALMSRYASARTLGGMDQEYLEQIHGLLERFNFRPATQRELARRRSFAEWAAEQQANGVDVVAPSSLLQDAFITHYTQMKVAEFRGLVDSVKQIAHLGQLKKELTINAQRREFDAVVQETVERLADLPQRTPAEDINPTRRGGLPAAASATGSFVRRINAALLKMETVFEWLDSKEIDGPFNKVVWEPVAQAQHERNDLLKDYTARLMALRNGLDKATQRRLLEKVNTPELLNKATLRPYTMRLEEVVAIALNWGNQGNREKLLKGYGWPEEAVQTVLDRHMTPDLWRFVQGTWDLIETLWPRIERLERAVNGVAPEKVEAVRIENDHGRFAGGYYPVVYDPLKSFDALERAAQSADSLFENIYTRATTPKGFTKERSEGYARPIQLSLDVIPRHVAEVIHDITHREALMQADKFLSNRDVMGAVEGALGREYVEQFRPWLQSIANEYAQDRRELAAWDAISKQARMRATMVGLGFRLTTILAQPAGLFDASEVIGSRWVAAGLAEAYGNPLKWVAARAFVFERSGEMRNRMNETERDVRDAMRGLVGKSGWIADARRFAYYGIAMMDMAVALPTWLGAYRKALKAGSVEADAVALADRAVRDSQGAAGAKDLAAVQRGPEFMKLATMFYSYFSHFYQRQATLVRDARNVESLGDVPHLLSRTFFLLVAPALFGSLLTGRGPDDDEDDWGAWAARKVGLGLFNGIPMVRDIASMAENELGGEYARGYQFTPIARLVDTVWKTAKDGWGAATGSGASDRWVQHALETSGYVFGLPLGQPGQSMQFLYNVADRVEQPDSIVDWLKGLTFGRSRDR